MGILLYLVTKNKAKKEKLKLPCRMELDLGFYLKGLSTDSKEVIFRFLYGLDEKLRLCASPGATYLVHHLLGLPVSDSEPASLVVRAVRTGN